MTLGELLEGDEAVECLKKGIELMITEKETKRKGNLTKLQTNIPSLKNHEWLKLYVHPIV